MSTPKRARVTAETLKGIGAEHAAMPLTEAKAKALAPAYESLLAEIAKLRDLPLKDIEPAMRFSPLPSKSGRRDD